MASYGGRVYGLGAIGLGIVEGLNGAFSQDWIPVPAHLPGYHLLAYAAAAVLILGGLAINLQRTAAVAALVLAALFAAGMLILELPPAVMKPADWGGWQAVAESTVMALGGVLAYARTPGVREAAGVARMARLLFGLCLLVFGGSHFVYAKFTASMVPGWLPPSGLFWAYATGLAQIAAGLAVLSGVLARRAAIALTAMYALFGLLVHLPSVVAAPTSHDNWAENAINLLLTGAAWCLADSLAKPKRAASRAPPPSHALSLDRPPSRSSLAKRQAIHTSHKNTANSERYNKDSFSPCGRSWPRRGRMRGRRVYPLSRCN